jgi:UDP-N-acetylglucosamine--N-acetylmuramyl-(pentapeptide) pyrophosphoryl-undecaprenol N-acetylglucosamine transferase
MAEPTTVVVTGGGSGGHITPILAVARELKRHAPETRIVYIGQTGDGLHDVVADSEYIDEMHDVWAGKFRRYHGEGLRQLLDTNTMYLNIRDGFRMIAGLWQSFWLLRRIRPGIIFTRGSFVSVPVCLAGALQGVPYVTHDSDAIPSLTNRIIARWAALHAVALPEELYAYPIDKTLTVGVPIDPEFKRVTPELQKQYRHLLGLSKFTRILLVTGGGLGAQRLNTAVIANAAELLHRYPDLAIVHVTGRLHEEEVAADYQRVLNAGQLKRVFVRGFITDFYRYSGAADLIIARGGATNLAEFAVQGRACIIVPNPLLTGGHQLKNTATLKKQGAIVEMTEEQIQQELRLASVVIGLFGNPEKVSELEAKLSEFAHPDAASRLAEILLEKARPVPASVTEDTEDEAEDPEPDAPKPAGAKPTDAADDPDQDDDVEELTVVSVKHSDVADTPKESKTPRRASVAPPPSTVVKPRRSSFRRKR